MRVVVLLIFVFTLSTTFNDVWNDLEDWGSNVKRRKYDPEHILYVYLYFCVTLFPSERGFLLSLVGSRLLYFDIAILVCNWISKVDAFDKQTY